jgi:hypothetical protein
MFAASKTDSVSGNLLDPQFNYVTMLLHGDGTNGAQNNTFLDSSSNNFAITRNGNTTQGSFGPYGSNWSNYFDGDGDFLTSAGVSLGTGNLTIEFWIYPLDETVTYRCVIDTRIQGGDVTSGFGVFQFGKVIEVYQSSMVVSSAANSIAINAWNHVALVRNSGTCQLYVNGVASGASNSNTNNLNSTQRRIASATTSLFYYFGYISNLREVTSALYNGTFTPNTTPLTAISGTTLLTCQSNRFIDNSTNNFAITVNGNTSVQRFNPFGTSTAYSTNVIGGSGYFDGAGDYLLIASNAAFEFGTGDFTVEGWFYQTADNTYSTALELGPHINANAIIFITKSGGQATIYSGGFFGGTTTTLNEWNHIAWVRSSGNLKIYVNGVSPAGVAFTNNLTNTSTGISIGDAFSIVSSSSYDYSGYMSNMRVVKGTAVYTANFTPPTTPLTAISGTSLLANFTNGAIFDNAMMNDLETVGNAQISTSVVKYGTGSMYFDGTGDGLFTISKPNLTFNTGDFTVEFWINLAVDLVSFAKIIQMGTTGDAFTIETQSTTNLLTVTNFTSTVYFSSSTALTTGSWIHVAATRASGTLRLFQNGTLVGSAANTVNFTNTGTGVYIGQSSLGTAMNGYIDDLRITKGYARYTANFTPPTAAFSNTGPY